MIHSPSRSNSEALAGVGLLNHPHRISDFSSVGGVKELGDALMKVIASKTIVIKNRYFVGLDIGNSL
jgi:hypothetical protein